MAGEGTIRFPLGDAERKAYGCLFCTTGKEMVVARMLEVASPGVRAIAARQEKHKSVQGKKSKVEAVILPSYVFFEAPETDDLAWMPTGDVIRVLSYEGDWRLAGEDERFVDWLFQYNGLLGFSQAYREGDRIKIISGPLKDMEGSIRKIDKRGHSGQVALEFNHKIVLAWLGFDLVNPMQGADGTETEAEQG